MAVVFVAAAVAFTAVGFGARPRSCGGQMIGIDLTGSARGTSATSYAIPVNDALAVASQLKRS